MTSAVRGQLTPVIERPSMKVHDSMDTFMQDRWMTLQEVVESLQLSKNLIYRAVDGETGGSR